MTDWGPRRPRDGRGRTSRPRLWVRRFAALVLIAAVGLGIWWLVAAARSGGPGTGAAAGSPPAESASPSTTPSPEPAAPPLPACDVGDRPAARRGYGAWKRTLLDTTFGLKASYAPPDLVSTLQAGFADDEPVRLELIGDLSELRLAAQGAGNPVGIVAGYRSYEQQAILFDQRVGELGLEEAQTRVARPGHSEHQLGTAVDFKIAGHKDVTIRFGNTRHGRWLFDHAWEYGFVLSYPFGATITTCYASEPWHYRYFGKEMAAKMHASGLATREYLWDLQFDPTP